MASVYILKSVRFEKTYVGSTTDLKRRLDEHNSGKNTFSRRFAPWVVVYSEEVSDLHVARLREQYLKSTSGRRWIRKNNIIPR